GEFAFKRNVAGAAQHGGQPDAGDPGASGASFSQRTRPRDRPRRRMVRQRDHEIPADGISWEDSGQRRAAGGREQYKMITRPLDLAAKLRPEPRNFDFLFLVNGGLLVLFFLLFESRFVLAPGLGLDLHLPEVPGARSGAVQ